MSYTLNETQAELESLLKEYEILRKDYDSQMKENDSMNQINRSNLQLIEELKNEKERTNTLLKDKSE
jgi:restriction endonuclease S subunit